MRSFIMCALCGVLSLGMMGRTGGDQTAPDQTAPSISGEAALSRLLTANKEYVAGHSKGPHRTALRREQVAAAQHPFAIIVSCSDSRVSPEILFDQGIGDLFVIRLAGNVVDDSALGSIEYGVVKLKARLILVLGHSHCGAVEAAVRGEPVPGHIGVIVNAIKPSVEFVRHQPGNLLENAIEENAHEVADKIKASSLLSELVRTEHLKITSAVYDLKTGKVREYRSAPASSRRTSASPKSHGAPTQNGFAH